MTGIDQIIAKIRSDLQHLQPYSSARSLIGEQVDAVFLDANEAPFAALPGLERVNRYPHQNPIRLTAELAKLYQVDSNQLLVCRGADEAIDLLSRLFGTAGVSEIVTCPPTFPMYQHSATIQGLATCQVPLKPDNWQLDLATLTSAVAEPHRPLVFICSPNNPTANLINQQDIATLLDKFSSTLFVIDETYFEYACTSAEILGQPLPTSWTTKLDQYHNLLVLRTLSKSHAAAGLRCGVAIGHPTLISWLTRITAPYPLTRNTVEAVLQILQPANLLRLHRQRRALIERRERLIAELTQRRRRLGIKKIYPSQANFILIATVDESKILQLCHQQKIIIRSQSHQPQLPNHLRISIGSAAEQQLLLAALDQQRIVSDQRTATCNRQTNETAIEAQVNLDQTGLIDIDTGVGFFDHMLAQLAQHGRFSLRLHCVGDLEIDAHHTIEDCAVTLGQALRQALGDKRGIKRYGFVLPMDESTAQATLDLSGRFFIKFAANFSSAKVGDFPTQMTKHFFYSLAENLAATLHLQVAGENDHHQIEALFKVCGKVFSQAFVKEGDELPSTKGQL